MSGKTNEKLALLIKVIFFLNLSLMIIFYTANNFFSESEIINLLLIYMPDFPLLFLLFFSSVLSFFSPKKQIFFLNLSLTLLFGLYQSGLKVNKKGVLSKDFFSVLTLNTDSFHGEKNNYLKLIRDNKPDIFFFQELVSYKSKKDRYPRDLKRILNEYEIISSGRLTIGSKFPILKKEFINFPSKGMRDDLIEADILINNRVVTIFNIHLYTLLRPDDLFSRDIYSILRERQKLRNEQLEKLFQEINKNKNPLIIAGDFNTPPRGNFYRRITDKLQDTFSEKGNGFGYTYGKPFPFIRIDYVFTGNGIKTLSAKVLKEKISDHYPLFIRVNFN